MVEGWAGSGMHGAHRTGPGDVELGRGACRKGGACPGGARKVMGRGLGAGHVVGVWDMLGGLGARVGWVEGVLCGPGHVWGSRGALARIRQRGAGWGHVRERRGACRKGGAC